MRKIHPNTLKNLDRTTHGMTDTKTYWAWINLKVRCDNPKTPNYHNYGGRGIIYCDRWKKFENFLEDMGEAPDGLTLERMDNNGNYCPENCRWATQKEQLNNTRRNHFLEYNGELKTISQWSDKTGIRRDTILYRVSSGWSIEKVLTTPVR